MMEIPTHNLLSQPTVDDDHIIHDHSVAQIPAASNEDKILINAFLQAETFNGTELARHVLL